MTVLDELIELRHACEKAVGTIKGVRVLATSTGHEREVTEFTLRYKGEEFVVVFRKVERQSVGGK